MKSLKMNSLQRLVAFILITVLLVCVVGFAAGGWQSEPNNEPDSGDVGGSSDETDENKDGNQSNDENEPAEKPFDEPTKLPNDEPIIEIPKYYSSITGLEISEEEQYATPYGFTLNPMMSLYGVSGSELTLEFPLENGDSRILSYTTDSQMLWKVGALEPTRAFISSASNFFGGIVVSYGNDDIVKYSAWDASKINLDISKISGAYYVENTQYIYTSADLVNEACDKNQSISKTPYKSAPYTFSEKEVIGTSDASAVFIPYSSSNETELYYSESSGKYLYFKSGVRKIDMLCGKNIAYTNVFILFANSTTYENANGTELVLDNMSGGSGYYISKGYMTEIRWNIDENGALVFKTLSNDILSVNPGNSYIGYYKASSSSQVIVE